MAIEADLRAEEGAARRGLGQDERGRAAVLLRGDGAHRQDDGRERPELGEVLPELVDRVGRGRRRDHEVPELVAAGRLEDLGQVLGEERRAQPDEQEQSADDGGAVCPPRLEQLLAQEDPEPGHQAARPTSRRNTSSSDGRTRSNAARRTPCRTTSGSSSADARSGVGHRHDQSALRLGDPVDPGDRPQLRGQGRHRRTLSGLGIDPVERHGIAGEQVVERALGHEPAVVEDADAVADALDVGQHVRGEDDRRVLAQLGDEREEVAASLGVERADRLVEDQQLGLGDERLGDAEPLAHPAGVPGDASVGRVGQADALERAAGPVRARRRPTAPAAVRPGPPARGPSSSRSSADPGRGRRSRGARLGRAGRPPIPSIEATPPVGLARPVMSRSVVVLPAPFGPSNPKIDPAGTSRSRRSTARTPEAPPNRFVSPRQATAAPLIPPRAPRAGRGSARSSRPGR